MPLRVVCGNFKLNLPPGQINAELPGQQRPVQLPDLLRQEIRRAPFVYYI